MNEDTQFENFKISLANFMRNSSALVDHVLSDESKTLHLAPLVPWISEVMSASMDATFLEKIALAYWSHMGMTSTSTPARLKIMELDGLSEAIKLSLATPATEGESADQAKLLTLCSLALGSLLDAIGDMFPWVRGILRSTQDAIDVTRT